MSEDLELIANFVVKNIYEVGDLVEGGVVFYIFQSGDTGYVEGETQGLVCAIEDQSARIQWYNGSYAFIIGTGTAVGTRQANTMQIIDIQGENKNNYAAGLAKSYAGGGNTDWFLPSKDALNEMYKNKVVINTSATTNGGTSFSADYYWSSTEYGYITVWTQNFTSGNQLNLNRYLADVSLRAVRFF